MNNDNKIKKLISISLLFLFITANSVYAKINIVTTIPDFAVIATDIGGDKVDVKSIVKGYQDPHFVDAKPSYILLLNNADLLIYNGLDLEIGWLPPLITGSRNSKISSPDAPGNLNISTYIPKILEVPNIKIDRSMGDIHPGGNPHYTLDPRNGVHIAAGIAERLESIDPANSDFYKKNLESFDLKLRDKIKMWDGMLAPYKGTNIVTYHKSWVYFSNWAGFKEIGHIEPKPGIPPSPSYLSELVKKMQGMDLKLILSESFYPQKTASLVAQKTGSKLLVLPAMVDSTEGVDTYFDLFDKIVTDITSVLKNQNAISSKS